MSDTCRPPGSRSELKSLLVSDGLREMPTATFGHFGVFTLSQTPSAAQPRASCLIRPRSKDGTGISSLRNLGRQGRIERNRMVLNTERILHNPSESCTLRRTIGLRPKG